MQTRRQARQAQLQAEAEAAQLQVQAADASAISHLAPTSSFTREPSPFSSTLSTLTPSTSSFSFDAGPSQPRELPAIIAHGHTFGVPYFPAQGDHRALTTPSNTLYYPPEVFKTPQQQMHATPTEAELRTAEWARDLELAKDERLRLTRTGTLLVPDSEAEPLEPGQGLGIGLGSAFVSPASQIRSTATPSRALRRVQIPKTRVGDGNDM
ncbi:hypothetical protein C8F01DRAFT_1256498 [Mycena amicta]|nr:hypothetical protein C8F01DRAFT_1256498 [Mycena amicta]